MKLIATLSLMVFCAAATFAYGQQAQPRTSREDALDPSPVDPRVDPKIRVGPRDEGVGHTMRVIPPPPCDPGA